MSMASHLSIEMQAVIPKAQGVVGLMGGMFVFWGHINVQLAYCIVSLHLLHTCACSHMHTCPHTYTHVHTQLFIQICMHTNIHIHIYTHMHTWRLFFPGGRRGNHLNFLQPTPIWVPAQGDHHQLSDPTMKVLITVCWNRRETGLARNEERGSVIRKRC